MHTHVALILRLLLIAALPSSLVADPIFAASTFDSGAEGWQPWATSTIDGISPGNPYLNIAADGSGVYGKMVTFNQAPEWTGDYYGTGVTGLQLDIVNRSDLDVVYLRLALGNRASPQQPGGTWFVSKTAVVLPTLSSWTRVFLPIAESEMVVVGNIMGESDRESFADTLGNIKNIRILSAAIPVGATGDEFIGNVGIDNVALVPEPSTLPLIGIGAGLLAFRQRRRNKEDAPGPWRERP